MNNLQKVALDAYILDTLLRDLVGHDRRPAAFLVYVWLVSEGEQRRDSISVSYAELAESTGLSRSSAQAGVAWLLRRKLISVHKANATAVPCYTVLFPWRRRAASR